MNEKAFFSSPEKERMRLTGTVTKVSATIRCFFQSRTRLPGKCPPVFIAVTLGRMVSTGWVIRRRIGDEDKSARLNQELSSAEVYIGTSKARAHSMCVV